MLENFIFNFNIRILELFLCNIFSNSKLKKKKCWFRIIFKADYSIRISKKIYVSNKRLKRIENLEH